MICVSLLLIFIFPAYFIENEFNVSFIRLCFSIDCDRIINLWSFMNKYIVKIIKQH